jgi:hypothetical protein
MWGAIIPKMKIDIKHGRDDTPELVGRKTHILGKNREAKVVRA